MTKDKILVIDDDKDLVDMLATFLSLKDLEVYKAYDISMIPSDLSYISLVILDINMPNKNGFVIFKNIRKFWDIPIIFLTARENEDDKIKGLMLGADDYVTKPFSLDELYARIFTNINRAKRKMKEIEIENGICKIDGIDIELTNYEYEIVDFLYRNPKQVFSKETIYDRIWGFDYDNDPKVIAEHIRNIRNKIKEVSTKEYIKTHWGLGYSWNF